MYHILSIMSKTVTWLFLFGLIVGSLEFCPLWYHKHMDTYRDVVTHQPIEAGSFHDYQQIQRQTMCGKVDPKDKSLVAWCAGRDL